MDNADGAGGACVGLTVDGGNVGAGACAIEVVVVESNRRVSESRVGADTGLGLGCLVEAPSGRGAPALDAAAAG